MTFKDNIWKRVIDMLKEHKQRHGHVNVAHHDDPRLHSYVCRIRKDYHKNQLTQQQVYDLFDLNFNFDRHQRRKGTATTTTPS